MRTTQAQHREAQHRVAQSPFKSHLTKFSWHSNWKSEPENEQKVLKVPSLFYFLYTYSLLAALDCCVTPRHLGSLWTKRWRGLPDINAVWCTSLLPAFPVVLSLVVDSVPSIASRLHGVFGCERRQQELIKTDAYSPPRQHRLYFEKSSKQI